MKKQNQFVFVGWLPIGRCFFEFRSDSNEFLGCFSALIVKLLFFSSIVVGEYDESVDDGETTVFFVCCRWFPFCLFGVDGKILFDEREGTRRIQFNFF